MDVFEQRNTATASRDGYFVGFSATNLELRVYGSAGTTTTSFTQLQTKHQEGRWKHYAMTFDDASNAVRCYVNGMMVGASTNSRDMTATASCTTRLGGAGVIGMSAYSLFDLQVFPDVVVPPSDIPLLMKPDVLLGGCRGRYCGLAFRGTPIDESGNGNDLSGTPHPDAEPPWRSTYQ
jgi:hypothetical protein